MRPLVVYLSETSLAPDIATEGFFSQLETALGFTCIVFKLDGRDSQDPDIELQRNEDNFKALKDKIKVRFLKYPLSTSTFNDGTFNSGNDSYDNTETFSRHTRRIS